MEPIDQGGVEIDVCRRCGGLWFDGGELAHALHSYDSGLKKADFESWLGPENGNTGGTCPRCSTHLSERELEGPHPLTIEFCPSCSGMSLKAGELERIQTGDQLHEARTAVATKAGVLDWLFQLLTGLPREFNFRPRRIPMVTWSLVVVNLIFFVVQLGGADTRFIDQFALYPERAFGAQWWVGLVTHNFLHANFIHLAGNLYFFWILGDNLEDLFGRKRFLAFCGGAALASGLAETLFAYDPAIPTIGFSGVVSAVLVAYAVIFRHARLTFMLLIFQFKLSAVGYVAIWLAFNIAGLVMHAGAVSFLGHIGGAAFGLVVALAAYRGLLQRDPLLRLLRGISLHQL